MSRIASSRTEAERSVKPGTLQAGGIEPGWRTAQGVRARKEVVASQRQPLWPVGSKSKGRRRQHHPSMSDGLRNRPKSGARVCPARLLGCLVALLSTGCLEGRSTAAAGPSVAEDSPKAGSRDSEPSSPKPVTLARTQVRHLVAESNGVEYELYVALPPSYRQGEKRYPLVVLLDADYSFAIARNQAEHLSERNHLPELILVGVSYPDSSEAGPVAYRGNRTRDYTPTHTPEGGYGPEVQKVSGGGARFRAFLEGQLLAYLDREYRTDGETRALVGHSYGGLFSATTLLEGAGVFDRFLMVSPSLWYDESWVFQREGILAEGRSDLAARIYAAVGDREVNPQRDMVADLRRFEERLRSRGYPNLQIEVQVLDAETHNSVFPRALSNGLRYLFDGR